MRIALLGSAVAGSLVLAACSSSSGTGSSANPNATLAECAPYSAYQGHNGTTVTIFASIISPESDSLQKSWAEFEKCTGIKISYEGSNDFESQLPVRIQGGNAPDLAFIPQPGLLAKLANSAVPAPDAVAANVDKYWNKAWKGYGTVNGKFYAAPNDSSVKSLVWYSPKAFKAAGYAVPQTWADLMKLSDTIAASGQGKPWCGGISSGTATGWPATDWIEELVLREDGPDVYDKWVSHEIKFSSPEITKAFNDLNAWMRNPKYVNGGFGGTTSIATTTFQDAGKPILTGKCWMLQQASFYGAQLPAGTKVGLDGDAFAFYMPPITTQFGRPLEAAATFVTAFADRPEIQAVQTYLSTPAYASSRVQVASGWVSANNAVPPALYKDPIDSLSAQLLTDSSATIRFDASDLMPAAVGAGSFWKEMTAWFGENKDTQAVLTAIDASWPS
jgi:alpha-glucoside transport system substrate-binding protein